MHKVEFDKIADIYNHVMPEHISSHYLNKRKDFIKRHFALLKNTLTKNCESAPALILDVGCGTGLLDHQLIKEEFRVLGLDISLKMLEKAKAKNMLLVCSYAQELPFKSDSFALVISMVTLHHIVAKRDIFDSLKEMVRVVKPQGRIIIWDHNPLNPYWPLFMRRMPQDKGITRLIGAREIVDDLKNAGIKRISIRRLGFIPDFISPLFLKPFKILEKMVEDAPLLNIICAHNVVVAQKEEGV